MVHFRPLFDDNQLATVFAQLSTKDLSMVSEATARTHLNAMRRRELNAPPVNRRVSRTGRVYYGRNPSRTQVRRVTGRLSATAFIRPEDNGNRQVITFPAPYAGMFDAQINPRLGFDIYAGSIERREDLMRRQMLRLARRRLKLQGG